MAAEAVRSSERELRRFARVPFCERVEYMYGLGEVATATCCDVGRGGISILMGRYLRPGRLITLRFRGESDIKLLDIMVRLAWCRPTSDRSEFVAGFATVHDTHESLTTISELILRAATALESKTVARIAGVATAIPSSEMRFQSAYESNAR